MFLVFKFELCKYYAGIFINTEDIYSVVEQRVVGQREWWQLPLGADC